PSRHRGSTPGPRKVPCFPGFFAFYPRRETQATTPARPQAVAHGGPFMSCPLTLVIHPAIDEQRLSALRTAAPSLRVINAGDNAEALAAMSEADAFFGKITPELLDASRRLRWVQSPTASLEHYLFEGLVAHPCVLTNMRGLL